MRSKMNIKSIVIMATVGIISLFFINMSLAANTGKISVETANLRETADENAKILELLSVNEEVEVIEKTGEWYKVKAKGITGFLRQDLITVNGEVVENSENTTPENETVREQETEPKEIVEKSEEKVAENSNSEKENEVIEEKEIKIGKQKVAENTALKIIPVINATNTIEVKKDEEVNAIEIVNGWVCVETSTAKGWIRKEKLQKEDPKLETVGKAEKTEEPKVADQPKTEEQPKAVIKTLYVNTSSINMRKQANTSAEILANLPVNTAVEVLAENNGWSQVRVNGKEGYILSTLLSTKKQETSRGAETPRIANTSKEETAKTKEQTPEPAPAPAPTTSSASGTAVVDYAKQFIGTKYKYGGSTPATGFDCSGFTSYVYKNFGISLPRTTGGQSGVGTAVSRDNLVAGDLVLYSGHVAIYVGGGQVIHSPRTGKTVCIVPINQAASNYLGARRVIQ